MSAIRAANAFVELSLRDSAFGKGLKRAERALSNSAAKMRKVGTVLLGAGSALAAPFVQGIRAASRMEETMNKFNVVFGESSGEVKAWADNFASQVGRSQQQVADFLASNQDLFIPLGFEPGAAQELSKTVSALAIDLASFNNKNDADVQRDLQAALTGFGEVMKKYGVVLSEAAVKQELLNNNLNPKEVTNAQKAQARLNIIMRGTTAAQGDAIRSAGSFENQWKRLTGLLDDAFVSIGQAVLPTVTMFVTKINEIVSVAAKWIQANQELVKWIAIVAAGLIAGGAAFIGIGGALAIASTAIGGLITAFGVISTVVTTAVGVLGTMAAAIGTFIVSPLGIAVVAIGGAVAAFLTFTNTGQAVVQWFSDNFTKLVSIVTDTIGGIFDAIKSGNLQLAAQIAFTGIKLAVVTVMQSVLGVFGSSMYKMFTVLAQFGKAVVGVFANLERQRQKAITGIATLLGKVFLDEDGQKALAEDRAREENAAKNRVDAIAKFDASKFGGNLAQALDPAELQRQLDQLNKEAAQGAKGKTLLGGLGKIAGISVPDPTEIDPSKFKGVEFDAKKIQQGQGALGKKVQSRGSFSGALAGQQFGGSGGPINQLVQQGKMNANRQKVRDEKSLAEAKKTNEILNKKKMNTQQTETV